MSDALNRLGGARSTLGMKTPVRAAVSTNITLSGLQTVDGVALAEGDRVLPYGQTDAEDNGIWVAATSAWTRAKDFDGTTDWVKGTLIPVAEGTINAGKIFRVTSADPSSIDVDDIDFESISFADAHANTSIVASATLNLDALDADAISVTGTGASISAITLAEGQTRILRFTEAGNTLVHSSTLALPGAQNIVTIVNDFLIVRGFASGIVRVISYERGDSHPLITGDTTVIVAATTDLGSVREQSVSLSGSTTITSFGSTAPAGALKFCRVSGTPLITNSAAISCPNGRSIQAADGDTFIARHSATIGNWRILNYTRAAFEPHTDTTQTVNATTAESDLNSYSLPAGRLASSGAGIRIKAWGSGTTVSTAATRRVRLYFGATVIADSGATNVPTAWSVEATVLRSSLVGTQESFGQTLVSTGGSASVLYFRQAPVENVNAAITVKVTGLCTASSSVLTQTGFTVEQLSL